MEFINRTREIQALTQRWEADGAQFALLYGRRRIGKTYLLQHFFTGKPCCYFLAAQTTLAENISQLAETLLQAVPNSGYTPEDLSTINSILRFASRAAGDGRFALVLDEFQYLLEQDASVASQIQAWWDTDGIRSGIFLVLCGSHLGMMEGLGGPQAPLFGRFTFRYKLPPMGYTDIAQFHAPYSIRDKLTAYGILGGTPRYSALFDSSKTLQDNVCATIMDPLGLLHNEPEVLMLSSRVRDPAPYNAALRAIASGCTRFNEISQRIGASSSQLSFYLRGLLELEWIQREYPFDETSDKRSIYRIADNFLLFWYRFVAALRSRLEVQDPYSVYDHAVAPFLAEYMGHQFEDICRQYLRKQLADIVQIGRYWNRDGSVEIDIMAELADGRYLFGECKWSSSPIGIDVYYELREKVAKLPSAKYRQNAAFALFSLVGFDDILQATARQEGIMLVSGEDL